MNNVVFGTGLYSHYETVCGGAGAGPGFDGASAVHTHMTNTRITDPEILEHRYPVRLERFAVRPDSQNRGVGRALLDEVEARARLRGCCKMTLEVHDTNDGAKRLYRRFGFGPWDLPTLFVSKPLR